MAFVAMLFAFCLWFLRLFLESLGPGDNVLGHRVVRVEAVLGPRFCCHFLVPPSLVHSLIIRWQLSVLNGVFHIRGKNWGSLEIAQSL